MFKVEVLETIPELKELLRLTKHLEVKDRILVLYWIKSNQVKTIEQVALLLGKHRTTIHRWLNTYRGRGLKALLTKETSSGRSKIITPFIEQSLKQKLQDKESFHSYKEAQLWLMQEHGIEISYTAVHHLIRYQLKQKLNISTTELIKQKLTRKKNEKISPKILSSSIKQQSFN